MSIGRGYGCYTFFCGKIVLMFQKTENKLKMDLKWTVFKTWDRTEQKTIQPKQDCLSSKSTI